MAARIPDIDRMSQDFEDGLLLSPKRLGSHMESGTVSANGGDRDVTSGGTDPLSGETQVDADLALARILQEQERRLLLNEMNRSRTGSVSSDQSNDDVSRSSSEGFPCDNFDEEERESFGREHVTDGRSLESVEVRQGGRNMMRRDGRASSSSVRGRESVRYHAEGDNANVGTMSLSDEDFARALQEEEYRERRRQFMALAGIRFDDITQHTDLDNENEPQDFHEEWPVGGSEEGDEIDELSYEELIALGEVVGTESRGLGREACERLPRSIYFAKHCDIVTTGECAICQCEYEEGEDLITLPCMHLYHEECILQWLSMNKVCPVCTREVESLPERSDCPQNY